jgi:hypothetical protein
MISYSFRSRKIGAIALLLSSTWLGACSGANSSGGDGGKSGSGNGGSGGSISLGGTGGANVGGSGNGGSGAAGGCTQNIDIVFVMDVSTSMGPFLSKLADEMPVVDNAVKQLNLQSTPHYGLVVFVDDTLFANTGQPYTDVAILQQDFKSWASFTSSNAQVNGSGSNSTWPENSIDGLYRAASEFPWRPAGETLRMVIHTTDDTFWQGPTTQDGVQILHNYSETVSALQQGQVRDFSFAAMLGGPFETDDVSAGWFGPYQGSKSVPDSTGGGVFKLDDVMSGSISLSTSINQAVTQSLCQPYPPVT